MYQITEDMMRDMARDRNDGASWAYLSRMYGIPAQSLKRAFIRKSREVYGDDSPASDPRPSLSR